MISREKCIKNLEELIEVITKEREKVCEEFSLYHPQQDIWSYETKKKFNDLIGPLDEIRDNLGNLINHFSVVYMSY